MLMLGLSTVALSILYVYTTYTNLFALDLISRTMSKEAQRLVREKRFSGARRSRKKQLFQQYLNRARPK